jgi:hypothetical protein
MEQIYQYDETGRLLHYYESTGDENDGERIDYYYDVSGRVETECYDGGEYTVRFKYNGDKLIREEWEEGNDYGTKIYNYDSEDNCIEIIETLIDEERYRNLKSYDSSGNCIIERERITSYGGISRIITQRETNKIERKYNPDGLLQEELKINIHTGVVYSTSVMPGESYYTRYEYANAV